MNLLHVVERNTSAGLEDQFAHDHGIRPKIRRITRFVKDTNLPVETFVFFQFEGKEYEIHEELDAPAGMPHSVTLKTPLGNKKFLQEEGKKESLHLKAEAQMVKEMKFGNSK